MASNTPLTLFCAALLLFQPWVRAQSIPTTPVGHWVAEHPSKGGIASWWNFRPDGTLTMYIGAAVTVPITRSGDTYTQPSGTTTGPPTRVQYRVQGATLTLTDAGHDTTYTRVGPIPNPSDLLLGFWRPDPPKTPDSNPNAALLEKARTNGLQAYFADSTLSVRIPFTSFEGTWDAATHTFHVPHQPVTFTYQLSGAKLLLAQPPDGHQTDAYLPDPLYP